MTPDDAFNLLIAGNGRFVRGEFLHPHHGFSRRSEVIEGQNPFAVIVTCSDSSVPTEIIFDCGIGDLFVVRVAGNVIDSVVMGSIVYAVHHLTCPLVVVLGHESCGVVISALNTNDEIAHEPPAFIKLLGKMRDNIPNSLIVNDESGHDITSAVYENTGAVVEYIKNDPVIKEYISESKVEVRQAFYSLSSCKVIWG
jgi:carbonic anhydrase